MIQSGSDIKKDLLSAAYAKRVLEITYCAPLGPNRVAREIEPYSVINVGEVSMLKAYQLRPTPGWRLFNVALIESVRDTEHSFEPRRSIVMRTNGEVKHIAPAESRDFEQLEYEKLLQRAIIDLHVDPMEVRELASFRERLGLTVEEVRGVHYKVFSDCLATVTQDRLVNDEERQMLIELNRCLHDCGAGLIQ